MKKSKINVAILAALLCIITASCCGSRAEKPYEPTWESIAKAQPAQWWNDAKFGIFIHWGPYSVAGYKLGGRGYAEAITSHMYQNPKAYESFFMEKFGKTPPEFGYKDWVKLYTAEKWDPQAWAALFKESGAKYVIPTAEHHDGFANWDSDLTPWNSVDMGPKRDIVGELAKAVRAEGLNYGVSYHRERHPSRFTGEFKVKSKPLPLVAEEIKRDPLCAELYGPFEYSDEFIADYVARWRELQDKYQPDFMWIDDAPIFREAAGDPQVEKYDEAFRKMISDYLNDAAARGKEVYFNNKGKTPNYPLEAGCRESDNLQMDKIAEKRWQNPATLGVSYAYMYTEEEGDLYKTPAELVRLLIDVVSKNGNLLLNIGPRADGTIPEGMQRRLRAMGQWLSVNGAAIYSTTPFVVFGEGKGDVIEEKDVIYGKHSMRIREREYRYTQRDNVVYASAFQPADGDVNLKSFADFAGKIESVTLMDGTPLKWSVDGDGLNIKYATPAGTFYLAEVYKITLK